MVYTIGDARRDACRAKRFCPVCDNYFPSRWHGIFWHKESCRALENIEIDPFDGEFYVRPGRDPWAMRNGNYGCGTAGRWFKPIEQPEAA